MCADQRACCAAVRLWFLSISYISGWAVLHILAPASLCIVRCFKLHVKNLHQIEVIITKILKTTLAVHLLILLQQILEFCTSFGLLMTPWDCYWRLKSKTPNLHNGVPLYRAMYCFVCFGAVCIVAWVLIRENVNPKIDGALSERDNFIPSFQRISCSLNKYLLNKTEHHHTHTADSVLNS
jgi:hypothetical protein